MFRFVLLDVVLVALLEVLGQDDVAVLAHGLHASLLTDGVDVGSRNLVRSENRKTLNDYFCCENVNYEIKIKHIFEIIQFVEK